MKLQESYGNDKRFKLDKRFQGDIELNKLPKHLKPEEEKAPNEMDQEKEMSLRILGDIVPSANRFIGKGTGATRLIKRFDPTRPNDNLVSFMQIAPVEEVKTEVREKDKEKGKDKREKYTKKKEVNNKKKDKKKHSKSKQKKADPTPSDLRKKAPRRKVQANIQISSDYFTPSGESSQFKLFG
jgi:hypothetical protein